MNTFEVKASFVQLQEDGLQKKVTKPYIVQALSCTEAEARAVEWLTQYGAQELAIKSVKEKRYEDVILSGGTFYNVKLTFVGFDERTGKETKSPVIFLVQDETFDGALKAINEKMKGTMIDYYVSSITETAIDDCFIDEKQEG